MFGPCSSIRATGGIRRYFRFRTELPGPRASASRNSRSASSSKPSRAVISPSPPRTIRHAARAGRIAQTPRGRLADLRVQRARSPIGSCSTRLSDRAQLHRARSLQSARYDRVRQGLRQFEPTPRWRWVQARCLLEVLDGRGPIPAGQGEPAEAEVSFIIGRVELERSTKTPLGRVEITQFVLDVAHDDEKRFAFAQRQTFLERWRASASFASSLRTSPSQK